MNIEFLLEDPSAQAALDSFLPKLIEPPHTFVTHAFHGKSDLFKNLPMRLKGYAARFKHDNKTKDWRIIVMINSNGADCRPLKRRIVDAAEAAGISERVTARIVVEELEAWYFGDVNAIRSVFPDIFRNLLNRKKYRDPDAIPGGTWKALDRLLKDSGYAKGFRKLADAEAIGRHLDPDRNFSRSFRVFVSAIRRILS
jgi:hypothetical protein